MNDNIIWDGSEQEFTPEQILEAQKLGDDYWAIAALFVPDIEKYRVDRWVYVIHHKDGNHWNQHPSNLVLMTRSAHVSLHKRKWWHNLSEKDYKATCGNMSEGQENMSPEDKRSKNEALSKAHIKYQEELTSERRDEIHKTQCKAQQAYHALLTPERKAEIYHDHGKKISKVKCRKGTRRWKIDELLKNTNAPFTKDELNKDICFADPYYIIYSLLHQEKIKEFGKNAKGEQLYVSLIYEITEVE